MIINHIGTQFHYKGLTYTIGDKIVAVSGSAYDGLYGIITEIRDGDDQQAASDRPDIYCTFMPPIHPTEITAFEKRFSCLSKQKKRFTDILLDTVMAPEMIRVLESAKPTQQLTIHIVKEDWAFGGDYGEDFHITADPDLAKHIFTKLLYQEQISGYAQEWFERDDFELNCSPTQYECWLHDDYFGNHYKVCIEQQLLSLNDDVLSSIGGLFIDSLFRKHFAEQTKGWEELEGLTDNQIAELVASPQVPQYIRKQLAENRCLAESYWESVSKAAFDLVKRYRDSLKIDYQFLENGG